MNIKTQSEMREEKVKARVEEVYVKCERLFGRPFKRPSRIVFDITGMVAGKAYYGPWKLDFNSQLLKENEEKFLDRTVGHEVAHLVAYELFNENCGHDARWQGVMKRLGLDSTRCHDYSVESVRRGAKRAKLISML